MNSLSEHYQEHEYLGEGWHEVTVKEHKMFKCNSGSPGVEFWLEGEGGRVQKHSIVLHPKSIWGLAKFAKACGMSKADMEPYDVDNAQSHRALYGRRCKICVQKEGEYHEITEVVASGTKTPAFRPAVRAPEAAPGTTEATAQPVEVTPTEDDIPF